MLKLWLPFYEARKSKLSKNDQAHVEQKNDTHVRQLLGYDRLGFDVLLEPMTELFEVWSVWRNCFCTSFKQLSSKQVGSKTIRRHEKEPKTPCDRLAEHMGKTGNIGKAKALTAWRDRHDPFELKDWIEAKLTQIWQLDRALQEAEADGEIDLEGVSASILADNPRSAPIIRQNRNLLLCESSKTNQNQDATVSSSSGSIAA